MNNMFRILLTAAAASFLTLYTGTASGAEKRTKSKKSYSVTENWNQWRSACELMEAGDNAVIGENYALALDSYQKALPMFQALQKQSPNWNKNVVSYRISIAKRKIKSMKMRLADGGGETETPADSERTAVAEKSVKRSVPSADASAEEEISALKSSLRASKAQIKRLKGEVARGQLAAKQVISLMAERNEIDKRYSALLLQYHELKNKPVDNSKADELQKAFLAERAKNDLLMKNAVSLQKDTDSLSAKLRKVEAQVADLEKKLELSRKEAVTAAETERALKELRSMKQKQDAETERKFAAAEKEIKAVRDELAKKSAEGDRLAETVTSLRKKLPLAETTRKIEAESLALKKENDRLRSEMDVLKEMSAKKDVELKDSSRRIEELSGLAKKLESQSRDYSNRLAQTKKTLSEREIALKENETLLASLRQDLASSKKQLKIFAERVSQAERKGKDKEAYQVSLLKETDQLKSDIRKLEEAKGSMEKENVLLKAQVAALAAKAIAEDKRIAEIKTLTDSNRVLLKENQTLKAKIDVLAKEKTAFLEKSTKSDSSVVESLRKLSETNAILEKENARLKARTSVIAALEAENTRLKTKTDTLTKQVAKDAKTSNEKKTLAEKNEILLKENAMLKQLADKLGKQEKNDAQKLKNVESRLPGLTAEIKKLSAENVSLQKENAALKQLADKLEKQLKADVQSLKTAENKIPDLAAKVKVLTAENASLQKENLELKSKKQPPVPEVKTAAVPSEEQIKLERELKSVSASYAVLVKEKALLKTKISNLENQLTMKELQSSKTAPEAQKLATELKEVSASYASLIKENAELKADKDILKKELAATKNASARSADERLGIMQEKEKLAQLNNSLARENELLKQKAQRLEQEKLALTDSASKNVSVENERVRIAGQNKQLQLENTALKEKMDKANEKYAADMKKAQSDLKAIAASRDSLAHEMENLVKASVIRKSDMPEPEKMKLLSKQLDEQTKKVAELKQANSSLAADAEKTLISLKQVSGERVRLNRELIAVQGELEKARIELTNNPRIRELRDKLDTSERSLAAANSREGMIQKQLEAATLREKELMDKIEKLMKLSGEAEKKSSRLETELVQWKNRSGDVYQDRLAKKDAAIDEIMKDFQAQEANLSKLKDSLDDANARIARYRKIVQNAQAVVAESAVESRRLRAELEAYRREDPNPRKAIPETKGTISVTSVETPDTPEPDTDLVASPAKQKKYEESLKKGLEAEKKGDMDTAMWQYLAASDILPLRYEPHLGLARVHIKLKAADRAKAAYEQAIYLGAKRDKKMETVLQEMQKLSTEK